MINRQFFFDHARVYLFGGALRQPQIDGLTSILDEWEENWAKKDDRWLAYMLATTHHETDRSMRPVEEYGKGRGRQYGKRIKMSGEAYDDTDSIFYGRGYVQLTWYENYERAGDELGLDLLDEPELALQPEIASAIMFLGMSQGWFTGKRLSQYFGPDVEKWEEARRIINGRDKASLIAGYARQYYAAISYTT
jgi:hypothetical protein